MERKIAEKSTMLISRICSMAIPGSLLSRQQFFVSEDVKTSLLVVPPSPCISTWMRYVDLKTDRRLTNEVDDKRRALNMEVTRNLINEVTKM